MNETELPNLEQIEALIAFLPRLYADGFSPIESWRGAEKHGDGSFTVPYPNYNPLVEQFFRAVSCGGWLDPKYNPEQACQLLQDENAVKTASIEQIKSMLTFCVRGEMIEKGYIRRLFERLEQIKAEQFK